MAAPAEEEEAAAAAAAEGGDGDEEALKKLEELVTELLHFRDGLPPAPEGDPGDPPDPDEPPPDPPRDPKTRSPPPRRDPLEEAMEETLRRMEAVQVSPAGRGRALVLVGRALGVCPTAWGRAEEALSRALKLEPGLGRAWIQLGELKWRRGDLEGARACFGGALQHGEEAEGRRLLSMALRAGGAGGDLRESLAQAEAAVRCDPTDGRSWYVLGNAYVSLFFAGGQSPDAARRALGAYAQAERVDPAAANNPDLHLNRATLLQYQERFGAALEGLGRAAALSPGWAEPRRRQNQLLRFLGALCGLLANGGNLRGKRRRGLSGPLPPSLLGPLGGVAEAGGGVAQGGVSPLRPSPIPALRPGPNPHRVLLGRVLFTLVPPGGVPYAVGLRDGGGAVAAVTVYNAAPAWGLAVGDALALPEPLLRQHQLCHQGQTFSFTGIRVASPLSLVVNGRRVPPSALAPPRLALLNEPGPPGPRQPPGAATPHGGN
ncbi:tetratricopeptide repeat protein 5 isoform X2 [Larus michahellis]|uniref:tetratricopeptide repeat protein 5 isoform X2 n=1 Tax=Larus michahellis TaxID=119627 RepID=UPI003D9BE4A3